MRRPAKKQIYSITILILLLLAGNLLAADTNTLNVSATVLSNSVCNFRPPKISTLNFGNLDPTNPVDVTTSTTATIRCSGNPANATFFITDDDGLYETGPDANRMRNTVVLTEFLPYSLTLSPITATIPKNTDQIITISGTVLGADYQTAYVGSYSDTVTITVAP